jgi:hypothetical protein
MIQDSLNQYIEAYLYQKIVKLPEILILELGRMNVTTFPPSKNNAPVDFEKEIDLTPFTKNQQNCLYDIIGIVNHIGSVSSGHYISFFNNGDHWIEFNDSRTRNISYEEVVSLNRGGGSGEQSGYLFFYRRRDLKLPNTPILNEYLIQEMKRRLLVEFTISKTQFKPNTFEHAQHILKQSGIWKFETFIQFADSSRIEKAKKECNFLSPQPPLQQLRKMFFPTKFT